MSVHFLESEADMQKLATALAAERTVPALIYLEGPLGAGKTTFARSFLSALGHEGPVTSPTYTLVESYPFSAFTLHHFDLYRLSDPSALYEIGFEDYLTSKSICLIEWPERAGGHLPKPTIYCKIEYLDKENTRKVTIEKE